ncbi:hypothetical protein CTI12_AA296550 [Artemisia annua]|uniref:COI1 F-box domain-containing protein n=1 Tax=Artemisia annua TaxID=35608 RepID=A0A2U1N7C1_ARTAN|nr:hypothetical protein CTI12_AA296550 [Artemisia annua]
MDTVFDCVIPYIHDRNDRNSVSLVTRKWYEIDCMSRKHVTVHLFYAPAPSRLVQRFPFLESLTLKGFPYDIDFPHKSGVDISPWIKEIGVKFECLKALHIRGLVIHDSDLKLLARTRGKDLHVLKIYNCEGFSEKGLMHISKRCNDLRTLCLENNYLVGKERGKWLHELALCNTSIELFHFRFHCNKYDVKDLALLVKNCSQSLVSLKISPCFISDLAEAFRHAVRLEDFAGADFGKNREHVGFKFPPNMRCLGMYDLPRTSFSFVLPLVNQLLELNLICIDLDAECQCFLIKSCPNLEVLCTQDVCGDLGLQVIGQFCKRLRKLTYIFGSGTHVGLIALAQGCSNLEYLHVELANTSNEAMECIGTNLKNLRNFRISAIKDQDEVTTYLPLDNGIQAMLIGCIKLERLNIHLCRGDLTDMGMGYIGQCGNNLRFLSLTCIGESDAGLLELSKGCPKLRKLEMRSCPFSEQAVASFVFNIHSLRYIWVPGAGHTVLALTRPNVELLDVGRTYW